ncbi:uncharacterized protein CTRU02_203997 [Colletotrichum truncatum]|uniref:Uncharacterized protein n=1 Tax=Colletotrichum truncatum TaxID=5467 RepID=A0ACC3ZAP9_COLTU|nr:uncharacterized protein CTRU02_13591 [Colletotrichum truncatum]KAF6783124.1 hypothetical protein CTRU02_13591 [Colletotrichum truncatum]
MFEWQDKAKQDAAQQTDKPSSLRDLLNPTPIPIIICGKTEQVGSGVIEGLKPEFEVIHFVQSPDSGAAIIPAILSGKTPPSHPDSSSIGTGNYTVPPRAVVLGSLFDEAGFTTIKNAVLADPAAKNILWLRNDTSKPGPPIGPGYPESVIARVREAMARLEKEGKLDGEYAGEEWY